MNLLSQHIEILLLDHDCVIVPHIGGFISNQESARYEELEKIFLPPFRSVAFNNKLTLNDGLLVQSYMQAYDAAYPEALLQLEKDVDALIMQLDLTGQYTLGSIGTLIKDIEGRITLQSTESGILSPTFYGLYSFKCLTVNELQKERKTAALLAQTNILPIQTEKDLLSNIDNAQEEEKKNVVAEKTEDDSDTSESKIIHLGRLIRYATDMGVAVAIAGVIFMFLSVSVMDTNITDKEVYIASTVPTKISTPKTEEKHNTAETPAEAPVQAEAKVKVETETVQNDNNFTIVLASYVTEINANIFIEKLSKDGFKEARFVDGKVRRVVYGSFATQEEAVNTLRQLRLQNNDFSQAWTMELK